MIMQNYFLTYGRGLEPIVVKELESLVDNDGQYELKIEPYEIEGKIIFSTNVSISRLIGLKTVERIFKSVVFKKFDDKNNDIFDENQVINYIDEKFDFDFKSYIPFEVESESHSNEAKRQCKGLKFRIDCRMTGKWKKLSEFKQKLIDKLSEKVLKSNRQSEVDLKSPDFWVTCHISDSCLAIGLSMTKEPLSNRSYLKNIGLRATICAAMLQIAEIAPDSHLLIIDPFCGRSTIASEMANSSNQTSSFWLCSDASLEQLIKSGENLIGLGNGCDLLRANLCRESMFPYRSSIADLIITDLPFGKNHSIEFFSISQESDKSKISEMFYARILAEFDRILAHSGAIIILVNSNEVGIFKRCLSDDIKLEIVSTNFVSLGETSAAIIKLIKR